MNPESTRIDTNKTALFSSCLVRVASGFMLFCLLALFMPATAQTRAPRGTRAADDADARADVSALLVRAVAALEAGRLDEAEPLLRRAVAAAPTNADAHSLLGALLDQRGRATEAEREY